MSSHVHCFNPKSAKQIHFLFGEGHYSKCPKILYTKVADKIAYANSADPDQTASEGVV